ncbi:hypothetical protein [Streptomyces sp. NPDC056160]|uniref:hypothetical protein n=1 Tax=Streptomyces sp. NPDC056160 TaxID=3345731 RepID=UPI0035D62A74
MLALAFLAALAADATPARTAQPNRPDRSHGSIDLTVPEIRHRLGHPAEPTEHISAQAAAVAKLAQKPPGHSPAQPLPATTRRPCDRIDREVALEY